VKTVNFIFIMLKCNKCDVDFINPKEVISCAECKSSYHPFCTRIESIEKFKKMSTSAKSNWKCDICKSENTSSGASRSDVETAAGANSNIIVKKLDEIVKNMSDQFQRVNDNFGSLKEQLSSVTITVESLTKSFDFLRLENDARKEEYTRLAEKNVSLENTVKTLKEEIADLQQRSRVNNLEIVGVPHTENENVYEILKKIAAIIKIEFNYNDISIAHRIPVRYKNQQQDGKLRHPTIIVQFVQRTVKGAWLQASKENRRLLTAAAIHSSFRSDPVFVSEHLAPLLKAALGRAKRLARERQLAYAWTRNGRVLIKRTHDGPAVRVWSPEDVDAVFLSD
jgi:regulator of replication initiation timing